MGETAAVSAKPCHARQMRRRFRDNLRMTEPTLCMIRDCGLIATERVHVRIPISGDSQAGAYEAKEFPVCDIHRSMFPKVEPEAAS